MTFLQGSSSISADLVHHTGTMIRFTTGQLPLLPPSDQDCTIRLPDGAQVSGHFRRNPRNPNISGRELVKWIKSWIPFGDRVAATVWQQGTGNEIRLDLGASATSTTIPADRLQVLRRARRLRAEGLPRRRRQYETWERDPALRSVALQAWGPSCQVQGCSFLSGVPSHLAIRMVDVHHLNHVSKGGTDSPLNISVLCVVHHQMIHRAPQSLLDSWNIDGAIVTVNGLTLVVQRDARLIL